MKKKILVAIVTVFALCIFAFSSAVSAIVSKNGSITLHVADSTTGEAIESASFRLYFFAAAYEKSNGIGYDYVVPYDDCNMDINNLQDAYLPIHLTHFAFTHDLPFTIKSSDKNGSIVFDNLVPGVYLIVPAGNIPDYFMPSPFVINIPVYSKESKNWIYDINATPKMQIYESEGAERTTYISVKKLWETDERHPEAVTVSLLCDYREVEKVVLSENNGWHYRWDNLSSKHSWSVVESEVADGYTVFYEASANTVTIINKSKNPSGTSSPSESRPSDEPTTKPEELVDTGQLNWPIPVLSITGLILFSIGWAILNLGKKDEEAA
ncbi:MAG: Cna B-type domain-containing protein [Clostridia bacterium]|nr:Cna B-type domain-containing protein [Clostridia bacterium]